LFRNVTDIKRLNIIGHFAVIPFLIGMVWFFFVQQLTGPNAILIYMILYVSYAISIGFLVPVWADFLASVTIPHKRGRFFGITFTSNAIFGMAGGYFLKLILENDSYSFPANFGFGWLIMTVAIFVGTTIFMLMKVLQPPVPVVDEETRWLKRTLAIYARDVNFRRYIYSRMFSAAAFMPLAFYAIDLQQRYDLPLSSSGTFTFFLVLGTAIFNYLLGYLGDTAGRKYSVAFFYIGNILAMLVALFLHAPWTAYLVFLFVGLSFGASQSSFMVFIYEFAGEGGDRKLYYAALETAVAPVLFVFISIAGTLVEFFGYVTLYALSLGLVGAGLLVLVLGVQAPAALASEEDLIST
jgi:MFS family permease